MMRPQSVFAAATSRLLLALLLSGIGASIAAAQDTSDDELVAALRNGGLVLVIRNGSSLAERPEPGETAPGNQHAERELSDHGQGELSVLGYALRELEVSIGQTLTGPAFRSRQSGNYFGLGERSAVATLGENADASWLAARVTEAAPARGNTVIITHGELIAAAFGRAARNLTNAETLIFRPRDGGADLLRRLTLEDWAKLAVN